MPFNRVYTHPLSQVVLEHLQNVHGEWLMKKGLERGLTINRGEHVFVEFWPYNAPRTHCSGRNSQLAKEK